MNQLFIVVFDTVAEDFFYTDVVDFDPWTEIPLGSAPDENTAELMVNELETGEYALGTYN